ncbi:MAG: hypothetical protein IKX22_09350 [Prevotella sp.]|nr:hypothetical protein [Prevotella sp.]
MKKLVLLLLATLPIRLTAQVNPQEGYIITNDNDTVHGTIDYLTDARNAKTCLFRRNGESEYKSLSPSDIKGYRLAGDGIYYVSRPFTGGEKEELLFAEFLLQGGVSLYRYYYDDYNYFGFVDSDGREVIIRDDKLNDDLGTYSRKLQERRQKVQEIGALMSRDNTIANRLWKMDLTSNDLTRLVRQYDEEYCTEAGDCVVFQYDRKKSAAVSRRFYVGAGICYCSYASPSYDYTRAYSMLYSEYTYSGIAPTFFAGADFQFPRFSKNLYAQAEVSYTPWRIKSSEENMEGGRPEMSVDELAARLGVRHVFSSDSRISPFIRAGINLSWNLAMKEKDVSYKYKIDDDSQVSYRVGDLDHGGQMGVGVYLGGGVDISHFRISASWKKSWGGKDGMDEKSSGILTAAWLF